MVALFFETPICCQVTGIVFGSLQTRERKEGGREGEQERRERAFFSGEPWKDTISACDARVMMMIPFLSIHTRTCIFIPFIYRLDTRARRI
jgi:hypothetical protein